MIYYSALYLDKIIAAYVITARHAEPCHTHTHPPPNMAIMTSDLSITNSYNVTIAAMFVSSAFCSTEAREVNIGVIMVLLRGCVKG